MMTAYASEHALYTISNMIGRGSFADVFLGYDKRDGRVVAIKQVFTSKKLWRELLEAELSVLKKIRHPNIVQLFDVFTLQGNSTYLALEYCNNGTLGDLLDGHPLEYSTTEGLVENITPAVIYLHSLNIWHRDIKPANILRNDNVFKLADFGMAKEDADMATTLCGSPIYMAPEILNRKGHSELADVWSYGAVLYQCITGHLAYPAKSMDELKNLYRKSVYLPDSDRLNMAVNMMLTLDKSRRPALHVIWGRYKEAEVIEELPPPATRETATREPATREAATREAATREPELQESCVIVDSDNVILDIADYQPTAPISWLPILRPRVLDVDGELHKMIWERLDDAKLILRARDRSISHIYMTNLYSFCINTLRESIKCIKVATQPHLKTGCALPEDFIKLVTSVKNIFYSTVSHIHYISTIQNDEIQYIDTAEKLIFDYAYNMARDAHNFEKMDVLDEAIRSYQESIHAVKILMRHINSSYGLMCNEYIFLAKHLKLLNRRLESCLRREIQDST